jgi:hypothetical protein
LGNGFSNDTNIGILDTRRIRTFDKRKKRTEDSVICDSTPCRKIRKLNNKDILRQYHRLKICHKNGRNKFDNTSRSGDTNSRTHQQTQTTSSLSTCTRNTQHPSGSPEPNKKAIIQINNSKEDVSTHSETMGTTANRRICSETQLPAEELLELTTRSSNNSTRCLPTSMAKEGNVPQPILETSTESTCTENKTSSSDNSIIAEPILVSYDYKNETRGQSDNHEDKSQMILSRLETVDNHRVLSGLNQTTIKYLHNVGFAKVLKSIRQWIQTMVQTPEVDPIQ